MEAATAQEFPNFLKGVAEEDQKAILPELEEMKAAWDAEEGLVPRAALKEIFQMSDQAAGALPGRYGLTEYVFWDKKWYSMRECKALHKLKRPSGFKGHSVARMVGDCFDDARDKLPG